MALSPLGEKIALEVIRHHRLIELYLYEALGYPWDEVHAEAERLEHVISEAFEDRVAAMLGNPEYDPHGQPIPRKDGTCPEPVGVALSSLAPGRSGRVARVADDRSDLLRYLASVGIVPGARVHVVERAPFDGPLHVRVGDDPAGATLALGAGVTDEVFVDVGVGAGRAEWDPEGRGGASRRRRALKCPVSLIEKPTSPVQRWPQASRHRCGHQATFLPCACVRLPTA